MRTIKRFAWLPKRFYNRIIWLQFFLVEQVAVKQYDSEGYWTNDEWIDSRVFLLSQV